MQTITEYVISIVVFCVLLGASFLLLRMVPPRYTVDTNKKEEIDYRVVHFTLRLALTFGIGTVVIGVLLVATLLML
jgi:hypothetical protein